MAFNAFLKIQANGEDAPVLFGEDTTQGTQGSTDVSAWIECVEFDVAMEIPTRSGGGGQVTGRRAWTPARFVLRLGKSTPWLFDAAVKNRSIDLTLHLFHQHHETGEIEQHFQYRVEKSRIVSIRLVHPQPDEKDSEGRSDDRVELQVAPAVTEIESLTGSTVMVDEGDIRV